MNSEGVEQITSEQEGTGFLRQLPTFWGVTLVLILAAYSVVHAVNQVPAESSGATARSASIEQLQPKTSFSSFVPAASYPEVVRETVILNLACGADDVRGGSGGAGRYPITMRFDQVPDDIRAVLSGGDTVFPKEARINMTPCIQAMRDRGELP